MIFVKSSCDYGYSISDISFMKFENFN